MGNVSIFINKIKDCTTNDELYAVVNSFLYKDDGVGLMYVKDIEDTFISAFMEKADLTDLRFIHNILSLRYSGAYSFKLEIIRLVSFEQIKQLFNNEYIIYINNSTLLAMFEKIFEYNINYDHMFDFKNYLIERLFNIQENKDRWMALKTIISDDGMKFYHDEYILETVL